MASTFAIGAVLPGHRVRPSDPVIPLKAAISVPDWIERGGSRTERLVNLWPSPCDRGRAVQPGMPWTMLGSSSREEYSGCGACLR